MNEVKDVQAIKLKLSNNYRGFSIKLRTEKQNLEALQIFLKEYIAINKTYGESLLKLINCLSQQFASDSGLQKSMAILVKELQDVANAFIETSKTMANEDAGAFSGFSSEYDKKSSNILKSTTKALNETNKARMDVQRLYEGYITNCREIERAQARLKETIESTKGTTDEELFTRTSKVIEAQAVADISQKAYIDSVIENNKGMINKSDRYHNNLHEIPQLEKDRIECIKKSISNSLQRVEKITRLYTDMLISIQEAFKFVNGEEDTNLFMAGLQGTEVNPTFSEIAVVKEERAPHSILAREVLHKRINAYNPTKGSVTCQEKDMLEDIIANLIKGKVFTMDEKANVMGQIIGPNGKHIFGNILLSIKSQTYIPVESFKNFGELLICLLNIIISAIRYYIA